MLGDYYSGFAAGFTAGIGRDSLLVPATDLDAPAILPAGTSVLTITEPGPVGIFATSINSASAIQQILRAGGTLPTATMVGSIADSGTMTTQLSVSQIQALLASTPGVSFDIVPLAEPPASYASAVDGVFRSRNGAGGTTTFDRASSGAMLQGAGDALTGGEDFDAFYFYRYVINIDSPTPSAGTGGTGRSKLAEGSSPLLRDRVFFRYDYLDETKIGPDGINLFRIVPGFEKTFFDGLASLEMRFPYAATIDTNILADTRAEARESTFGNVALYTKLLLDADDDYAISAGFGLTLPTADDVTVMLSDFTTLAEIDNDSVHFQPYVGAALFPDSPWFAQGILQLDFDTNGNAVYLNSTGTGLTRAGTLNDAAFMFLDASIGYWVIEPGEPTGSSLNGFAPTLELHHNRSLSSSDSVSAGALRVGNFGDSIETVNLVLGANLMFGESTTVSAGWIIPVGGGGDQQFDGGLRLLVDARLP